MMEVWAHRGWSGSYPENTLEAFAAALKLGITGLELDVRLSADHAPVVIHDERVDRTTNGTGAVSSLTLAQLKALDAGAWFHPQFAGLRIPTLGEALDLVVQHGRNVRVNVELKATREGRAELVRNAWNEVVRRRLHTQVVFSSFDWLLLRDLRRYATDAELAVLSTCWNLHTARAAEDIGASAVHLDAGSLHAEAAEQVHAQGLTLRAFTVNDLVTVAHLSSLGVDGVFTDHPDQMLIVYRR